MAPFPATQTVWPEIKSDVSKYYVKHLSIPTRSDRNAFVGMLGCEPPDVGTFNKFLLQGNVEGMYLHKLRDMKMAFKDTSATQKNAQAAK